MVKLGDDAMRNATSKVFWRHWLAWAGVVFIGAREFLLAGNPAPPSRLVNMFQVDSCQSPRWQGRGVRRFWEEAGNPYLDRFPILPHPRSLPGHPFLPGIRNNEISFPETEWSLGGRWELQSPNKCTPKYYKCLDSVRSLCGETREGSGSTEIGDTTVASRIFSPDPVCYFLLLHNFLLGRPFPLNPFFWCSTVSSHLRPVLAPHPPDKYYSSACKASQADVPTHIHSHLGASTIP